MACSVCGTIHGIVERRVDGEVKEFCVHHLRGEPIEKARHRNPPKHFGVGTGRGLDNE